MKLKILNGSFHSYWKCQNMELLKNLIFLSWEFQFSRNMNQIPPSVFWTSDEVDFSWNRNIFFESKNGMPDSSYSEDSKTFNIQNLQHAIWENFSFDVSVYGLFRDASNENQWKGILLKNWCMYHNLVRGSWKKNY